MSNDLYDQEILPLYEYAEVPVPESVLLDTEHRFPSFMEAMREGRVILPKNIVRDILSIYNPVRHGDMDIYHFCLHDSYKLILELMSAIGIIHRVPSYRLTERGETCYRILRYAYRQIQQEDLTLSKSTCDQ